MGKITPETFIIIPLYLLLLIQADDSPAQSIEDGNLYGMITTNSNPIIPEDVMSTCYHGFGLENCDIGNLDQLELNGLNYTQLLPSLLDPSYFYPSYCLMWPFSVSYSYEDSVTWHIQCKNMLESDAEDINRFGGEVRFSAHRWDGDEHVISCPIVREACSYSGSGNLLGCVASTLYLHSYNLTVNIKTKHDGEDSWRSVDSCEVAVLEARDRPKSFEARITMVDVSSKPYVWNRGGVLYFTGGLIIITLFLCRQCRQRKCVVCSKPLIICSKRCIICRFMENPRPPPALMHMVGDLRESKTRNKDWFEGPDDNWLAEMKKKENRRIPETLIIPAIKTGASTARDLGLGFIPPLSSRLHRTGVSQQNLHVKAASRESAKIHPVDESTPWHPTNTNVLNKSITPNHISSTSPVLQKSWSTRRLLEPSVTGMDTKKKISQPARYRKKPKKLKKSTITNAPATDESGRDYPVVETGRREDAPYAGSLPQQQNQRQRTDATATTGNLSASTAGLHSNPYIPPLKLAATLKRQFSRDKDTNRIQLKEAIEKKIYLSREQLPKNPFLERDRKSLNVEQLRQQFKGKYIPNMTPPEGMNPFTAPTPRGEKLKKALSSRSFGTGRNERSPKQAPQSSRIKFDPILNQNKKPKMKIRFVPQKSSQKKITPITAEEEMRNDAHHSREDLWSPRQGRQESGSSEESQEQSGTDEGSVTFQMNHV
mmetsp:Transcript_29621/g.38126  ORF Transcript_29621/g.38126 Transcript_29621/m.38126 type:complete len:713 (+) Transcript_29621:64-2202(+)